MERLDRQFEKAELDFDDNVTILAGANNSGKTSLITLIKNMMSNERIVYSESDIPAKNMRVWIDKVYPLFEKFFMSNNEIDVIETELLNKILPESDEDEKLVIKTTEIIDKRDIIGFEEKLIEKFEKCGFIIVQM